MTVPANRKRPLWIAAMIHRLSGLGLAIFLPFHFLVLGLAIRGEAQLDNFLRWTEQPLVKFSESALVGLLAVHMLGGLRLLALENMSWHGGQAVRALGMIVIAALVAVYFLLRVF